MIPTLILASFAEELVRRPVLMAAGAGHEPGEADPERAITRSLLGPQPDRVGS